MDFYKKRNLIKEQTKRISSPLDDYSLTIEQYKTGPGTWNYSKGTVRDKRNKIIAEIYRNYGSFWYSWIEGHPDGHDYLLCGEDYQGQTVIQLNTGLRKDYLPAEAKQGFGFCWVRADVSPDNLKLAVSGCIWGGPYEVLIVDFTKPLEELPLIGWLDTDDSITEVIEWNEDNTIYVSINETYRVSDGKSSSELTGEENTKMWDEGDFDDRDIPKTVPIKLNDKKI